MTNFKIKKVHYAEYAFFSVFGVTLLYLGVVGSNYKIHVLSITCVLAIFAFASHFNKKNWTLKSLGIRFDNISKEAVSWYLFSVAFIGVPVLWAYSVYFNTEQGASESTILWYSLLGCVAQEFLFRVYLMKLGEDLFGEGILNDSINVLVFTSMHIVYDGFFHQGLWLLMLLAGILFTGLFKKYTNVFLVTGAHIILNIVAVSLGIFH